VRKLLSLALLLVLAAPLLARAPKAPLQADHELVNDQVPADAEIEAYLAPLRAEMDRKVNEVLGEATGQLDKGNPESTLGNFVCDAMRQSVAGVLGRPADVAVTNNGGLRAGIPRGPITLRTIIEVMPFDNRLVLVKLTGAQLQALADQIASQGGVPQSGLTLVFEGDRAISVRVGDRPLDPAATYVVVTTDYLQRVSGKLAALSQDPAPVDTGLLLRDVLVDAVRARKTIVPTLDRRARFGKKGDL